MAKSLIGNDWLPYARMNDKQKTFAQEYLKDSNAAQAAIRAGYSKKGSDVRGSILYNNPEIRQYIKHLQEKRVVRTELTSDYVVTALREIGERCLQKVPVMEWDYGLKGFVQKKDENGNAIWQFDSNGANKSYELLGKHLGIFEKDNTQKTLVFNVTIPETD